MNPDVLAQVLEPSAEMMAALSRRPLPTRLEADEPSLVSAA